MREDVAVRPDVSIEFGEVEEIPVPPAGTLIGGNDTANTRHTMAKKNNPTPTPMNTICFLFIILAPNINNIKLSIFHKISSYILLVSFIIF